MTSHNTTPTIPPAALSVAQFVARYGVSKGTVFALLREKKIERRKQGRRTLIPVESAEAWWNSLAEQQAS